MIWAMALMFPNTGSNGTSRFSFRPTIQKNYMLPVMFYLKQKMKVLRGLLLAAILPLMINQNKNRVAVPLPKIIPAQKCTVLFSLQQNLRLKKICCGQEVMTG